MPVGLLDDIQRRPKRLWCGLELFGDRKLSDLDGGHGREEKEIRQVLYIPEPALRSIRD